MASVNLQEKANFTRLTRLLVDKGTEALRNTFDAIHPPANLQAVLAGKRASLLRLKPRVINNHQWDLLFPPSGNPPYSKTFDVTLLTVLFRNICGFIPPITGWDAMPVDTDRSMEANIVRLKFLRNNVYAHVTSTQVDNATFESLWQKISQALVELNIPQNDVDDLKTCSLDKESDENLLQKLAKHNFKSKIRSKGNLFLTGTREWLLEKVEQFAKSEEESRMLLLTAGPGFGKSVFAAKVCEDFKKKGKLAASHFCDFSNSNLRNPMMMLQSLASQMCENIPGFREKLLDQLRRPHQVRSLKDAFTIYLQNPLDELDQTRKSGWLAWLGLNVEEPSLVVIDGLDESAADDKNEIMNLIADYFPDLPECIKFLVTSRPELSIAKLRDVQKINIDSDDASNNSDLKLYLKACLPSLFAGCRHHFRSLFFVMTRCHCNELVWKCEGSFLYAFYVQIGLRKRNDLDKMTFNEIMKFVPNGLDSIYLAYFNRLQEELRAVMPDSLDVLRILEMLAVSKAPLPLSFISRALGLATDCRETRKIINNVNETVSCLLYTSDELVTVFHKSVIDWLLAKGYKDHEYTVKVMDGNKSLWLICENVFEEIKKSVCSGHDLNETNDVEYALKYGFDYLEACSMEESLFWSVDVIIIYVWLSVSHYEINCLLKVWRKIVQLGPVVISDKLRERLLWHVVEIGFLLRVDEAMLESAHDYYLQSVLTHSPDGCFSDNEKKIAKSLLHKIPRFVECNFINEAEVLPLAAWCDVSEGLEAVGLSHDKTMAAVVLDYKTIRVTSVPSLVELWHFSLDCIRISCCLFAPDDSFILFGKLETVLSIAERKEVPFFHGNKETFDSCAFSPNGKRLVTNDIYNDTIKLWDVSRQSLLASLRADQYVYWCSFSSTGLFIIGYSKCVTHVTSEDSNSFCVWNAITWQRSDERNIRDVKLQEPGVFQDKKCKRCFRPGIEELNSSKRLEVKVCMPFTFSRNKCEAWSTGIYNGVECSFCLKDHTLSVIESTHFTTLAAWDLLVDEGDLLYKITAIEDDLWFYADADKLIVFRTSAPTHQQSSRLPRPTRVLSSSFSPDGSRLATCTSDGYINIWNVNTGQVEQRFKSNQDKLSFACWWSEEFFYVFDFFDRIPSLSKYPVDVNLKILFPQSQQVSLCHLVEEFVSLAAIVDFSDGLLSFECGETEPVKVLDVSGVGGPRMATLPGIEPGMSITVSPGASFVFGGNKSTYYIWKRNAKKGDLDVYEIFFTGPCERYLYCCFSNDSKVAVVVNANFGSRYGKIFDLDTGDQKSVKFDFDRIFKLFCLNKDKIVVTAHHFFLEFFDMDSGARLESSLQRYLTEDALKQLKLSRKETMIAFPKINGDMEFLRLCIPQNSELSSIKREAAIKLHDRLER
jgi:WD40 repeat protein